jgi:hypothetical protein
MVSNAEHKDKAKKKRKYKKNAHDYVNYEEEFFNDCKFKTELCSSYTSNGFCRYGNKCRFAHGKTELFDKSLAYPKYKQTECNSFFTYGSCAYGLRCHFKHDDRQLTTLDRSWHTYNLLVNQKKTTRLEVFKNMEKVKPVNFPMNKLSYISQIYQILLVRNNTLGIH